MQVLIILALISLCAAFAGSRPDATFYDEKGKRAGSVKHGYSLGEVAVLIVGLPVIFAVVFYAVIMFIGYLYGFVSIMFHVA
jgi:hypothetical protein